MSSNDPIASELDQIKADQQAFEDAMISTTVKEKTIPVDSAGIVKYLMGQTPQAPEGFEAVSALINNKLNQAIGFVVVQQFSRITKLASFLTALEDDLCSEHKISNLTTEDKVTLMVNGQKTMMTLLDFSRKYLSQLTQMNAPRDPVVDRLVNLLSSLAPEKKQELLNWISQNTAPARAKKERVEDPDEVVMSPID